MSSNTQMKSHELKYWPNRRARLQRAIVPLLAILVLAAQPLAVLAQQPAPAATPQVAPVAPQVAPAVPQVAPTAPQVAPTAPVPPPPAAQAAPAAPRPDAQAAPGNPPPTAQAAPTAPAAEPVAPAEPAAPSAAAPSVPPGEPAISNATLPQDLSPWGMFLNADIIVKVVMIGLAFASFVTWTVWLSKSFELRKARRQVRSGLQILNNSATLAHAHDQMRGEDGTVAQIMQAAGAEIRLSANLRSEGLKERIALQLERIEMASSRKISRGTGVLATIGATAPFVGLFGTVWGIMNSFIGISRAHTTNLAVVAPGIAEALLATALGLVAAIPAVMIYNVFARSTAHYRALVGDASAQVMRLVSRDLDRAKLPLSQAAE
jgi:biopolymer transport protein ExbB